MSNERRGIIADLILKGPPDLVIVVLSPGTARRDRGLKHRLYVRRLGAADVLGEVDLETVFRRD